MQFRDLLRLTLAHSITLRHLLARYSFVYKIVFWARPDSVNLENPLNFRSSLKADKLTEL